jgi:hypothetical protein
MRIVGVQRSKTENDNAACPSDLISAIIDFD